MHATTLQAHSPVGTVKLILDSDGSWTVHANSDTTPNWHVAAQGHIDDDLGVPSEHRYLKQGVLTIDTQTRDVDVAGKKIELTNYQYLLLATLTSDPTRVFTKQELLKNIWGIDVPLRTRTLDSTASRLRGRIDLPGYVINCWGVGYRLVAAL